MFDRSFSGANDAGLNGASRGVRLHLLLDLKDKEIRVLAASLPWELLHDSLNWIFYGQGRQRLLVRHPEASRPVPLAVTPPLRILLVPSSSKN